MNHSFQTCCVLAEALMVGSSVPDSFPDGEKVNKIDQYAGLRDGIKNAAGERCGGVEKVMDDRSSFISFLIYNVQPGCPD